MKTDGETVVVCRRCENEVDALELKLASMEGLSNVCFNLLIRLVRSRGYLSLVWL